MNIKPFWDRVKKLIKQKGVTQEQAARDCGISYQLLKNRMCMNYIPTLDEAYALSRYLGVSLEYLINGQGEDKISRNTEKALSLLKEAEGKLMEIRGLSQQLALAENK
jgi:transcriptional regulator with XRE-family HTH domain